MLQNSHWSRAELATCVFGHKERPHFCPICKIGDDLLSWLYLGSLMSGGPGEWRETGRDYIRCAHRKIIVCRSASPHSS